MKRICGILCLLVLLLSGCTYGTTNFYSQASDPSSLASAPASGQASSSPAASGAGRMETQKTSVRVLNFTNTFGQATSLCLCAVKNTGTVPLRLIEPYFSMKGEGMTIDGVKPFYPPAIDPGETAYAIEYLTGSEAYRFSSLGEIDVSYAQVACDPVNRPALEVTNSSIINTGNALQLRLTIENRSNQTYDHFWIACPVFDANGEPVAVITKDLYGLTPGRICDIQASTPFFDPGLDYTDATFEVMGFVETP